MHYFKTENQNRLYTNLMNDIKRINFDYISLKNSKEYRIGKTILETKSDLKKFRLKSLFESFDRKRKGIKMSKVKSNSFNVKNTKIESNYFSNKRIAIYTSIFGNYDTLLEPLCIPDNCDFFVITDFEIDKNSKWKKMNYLPEMKKMTNIEKNRYVKINPHLLFKNYEYSIYIDGNIEIVSDLTEYINILNETGIGMHLHNQRNCVFDELKAVKKSKKDTKENIQKHYDYLVDTKMPKNYGLLQCSVIVREHNNPTCIKIMNEWWEEFEKYSKRDQISFPHILYKNGINVEKIGILGNDIYKNPSFRIINHK